MSFLLFPFLNIISSLNMSGLRIRVYECIKGVTKVTGLQKEDLASGTKIGMMVGGRCLAWCCGIRDALIYVVVVVVVVVGVVSL